MIKMKTLQQVSPASICVVAVICFSIGAAIISASKKTEIAKGLAITMVHLTGWRISHLLLHMVLAMIYPARMALFFSLGVVWELIEYLIGLYSSDEWWGGSVWAHSQDIIANTLGFLLGMLVSVSSNDWRQVSAIA
jgi:hypothetical protein